MMSMLCCGQLHGDGLTDNGFDVFRLFGQVKELSSTQSKGEGVVEFTQVVVDLKMRGQSSWIVITRQPFTLDATRAASCR